MIYIEEKICLLYTSLCVIGVTSINRYNDMKEAGNMFAGAAGQLDNNGEEKTAAGSGENTGFQIEEKQAALPDTDNGTAGESISLPVISSSVNGTAPEEQQSLPDAANAGEQQVQNLVPETQAPVGQSPEDSQNSGQAAADQDTAAAEGQNTPAESDAEVQPASDITSDAVAASAQIPSSYIVQSGDLSLIHICKSGQLRKPSGRFSLRGMPKLPFHRGRRQHECDRNRRRFQQRRR